MAAKTALIALALLMFLVCSRGGSAQQQYSANDVMDCYNKRNTSSVRGYVCGGNDRSSCLSYLFFRSNPPYDTPVQISYLLSAAAQNTSVLNNVTDIGQLPTGQPVLVPVTCSCAAPPPGGGPRYYQHDASYTLKWTNETYQIVANNTYQGLTSCQAMMFQNPLHDSYHLLVNQTLKAPLRCACPTAAQTNAGFRYLVTYPVTWGDNISSIASKLRSDEAAVLLANGLSARSTIFPFTTLLVPLKEQPTSDLIAGLAPENPAVPPTASPAPPTSVSGGSGKGKKPVAAGVGIGVGIFVFGVVFFLVIRRRKRLKHIHAYKPPAGSGGGEGAKAQRRGNESSSRESTGAETGSTPLYGSSAITTTSTTPSTAGGLEEEARLLAAGALVVYKYSDLHMATGFFGEGHRISGSVYRGVIRGDTAAVKRMKGDVSGEVAILKRFNHSSLVRLSGFCVHAGDTYLVFEYAAGGSLSGWLRGGGERPPLSWKRRVQVAYDVADGLNYLHNYASPACVHKDLRSSNVLLDGEFRAKLSNFGLARQLPEDDGGPPQLTRHVVGTQGYMAPEYLEHGLISPKMDIFALGVVLLELLSGRDAVTEADDPDVGKKGGGGAVSLLWEEIEPMMGGEDAMERLSGFIDPRIQPDQYPFDAAFNMAQLARRCVARDPAARPTAAEALITLSAVHSNAQVWESSSGSEEPDSMVYPE